MTTAQLKKLLTVSKNVALNSERHLALRWAFAHLGLTFGGATYTGQRMPSLCLKDRTPVELLQLYGALQTLLPALLPQDHGNIVLGLDIVPSHGDGVYGLEVKPNGHTMWTMMVNWSTWPQKTYPSVAAAIWQLGAANMDYEKASVECKAESL